MALLSTRGREWLSELPLNATEELLVRHFSLLGCRRGGWLLPHLPSRIRRAALGAREFGAVAGALEVDTVESCRQSMAVKTFSLRVRSAALAAVGKKVRVAFLRCDQESISDFSLRRDTALAQATSANTVIDEVLPEIQRRRSQSMAPQIIVGIMR